MKKMDYVIKNHKNLYIRLNKNGTPVTCAEHEKTLFEQSKAKPNEIKHVRSACLFSFSLE